MTASPALRPRLGAVRSSGVALAVLLLASPAIAGAQARDPASHPPAAPRPAAATVSLFEIVKTAGNAVTVRLPTPAGDGTIARYLYTPSVAAGLGSVDIGLDRARLGETQIIRFRKVGGRVLAEFENNRYRALADNPTAQAAVERSFSRSPIWSGEIVAEDGAGIVVDLGGILMRDALNVAGRLKEARAGTFRFAPALSAVDASRSAAFRDNVEFETEMTFSSDEPARWLERLVPDARSLTVRVRHSFVRLPDAGFRPRRHDPRTGTSVQVIRNDYAAALDQPIVTRLVRRFRLEKVDPRAARSRVKKPIVFHVDPAAPEEVRTALREGAEWWAAAFEAAGFIDAFRVETLPAGADPMDARYNVIAWVHRETRGWSTGSTVVDPRTGEIVRGVVQLGSLRAWHDRLIFEGLSNSGRIGTGRDDDPVVLVRARLRQLAVHEVGHALGLSHNFAGSSFADRASVMDYPAPRVKLRGGRLDFSDAYARGVGAWDRFAIDSLYREFAPGTDEDRALNAIAREARARGYRFVADADSRDEGAANPWGNMWDDGADAVKALDEVLDVRRVALSRFGLGNAPAGAAAADLRRRLVPIYLYHRYQLLAAAKLIGGVDYSYAVVGDGHETSRRVPAARQREALETLLATLDPATLDLPDGLLPLLNSVQSGTADRQSDIEMLPSRTAAMFDWARAAEVATDIAFDALLAPERLNRLVLQRAEDPGQLALDDLLQAVSGRLFGSGTAAGRRAEIARQVRARYVVRLLALSQDPALSATAQAMADAEIGRLRTTVGSCRYDSAEHCRYLDGLLSTPRSERRTTVESLSPGPPVPAGAPIGSDEDCWFCGPGAGGVRDAGRFMPAFGAASGWSSAGRASLSAFPYRPAVPLASVPRPSPDFAD